MAELLELMRYSLHLVREKKETPMYSEAYTYAQVSNIWPFNSHGIKHTHLHEHSISQGW